MTLQNLETVEIPLNRLTLWDENVRSTGAEEGLSELVASISSIGLLHGLIVQKTKRGQFTVVAGKRRFLALSQLAETGEVKRSYPVPCRVVAEDADLTEISLAENVIREDMSVFQEVSAFRVMVEAGKSVADISARFGASENIVNCRLALARVSPALWKLYEEEALSLGVLQAFTLTNDHAIQERIWNELPEWDRNNANTIRRILLKQEIPATDRRVRFVGLERYEAAGGGVRRDLFSEGEEGVSLTDEELLSRLVNERLESLASESKAEGWKWIEVQPQVDHQALGKFRRIQGTPIPVSKKETKKIARLEAKKAKLQQQAETDVEGDQDALYDEMESLQDQIEQIKSQQVTRFDDEIKAQCGTIVTIDHSGEPQLIRGLLRKEDAGQLADSSSETDEPSDLPTSAQPRGYSAFLVETLTTIKTAAIAAELSRQPQVALAGVVHALVLSQFGLDLHIYRTESCIQVRATQPNLMNAAASAAVQALSEQQTEWLQRLPNTSQALWAWCLEQTVDTLLSLLALCSALCVNGIKAKADSDQGRLNHANALATALNMDTRRWFAPTADNFFSKVNKPQILEAMKEAGKAPNSNGPAKLKKVALAELAEKVVRGTGWLPEPIRILMPASSENGFGQSPEEDVMAESD